MNDSWLWQLKSFEHSVELLPSQPTQAIAASKPHTPDTANLVCKVSDAPEVADDAIIAIVAALWPGLDAFANY